MGEDATLYSITIIGAMNPRIHHPAWYKYVGLLEDPEVEEATENVAFVCTQPLSAFQLSAFRIVCQMDRWSISTAEGTHLTRVRLLAAEMFDRCLPQTPVRAFGFNFDTHCTVSIPDVGARLAASALAVDLGVERELFRSASFVLRASPAGRDVNLRIEPSSKSSNMVFVGHNFHYTAPQPESKSTESFHLTPLFDQHFETNLQDAEQRVSRIVEALERLEGLHQCL